MRLQDIFHLLRPNQWYKNLLIFLAIIFSKNIFNFDYFKITFFGFVVLVIISSANYILNDLIDLKKDRINPEKKERPIASKKITLSFALLLFFVLLITGLIFSYMISIKFFYIAFAIFGISTIYTFYLKNVIFADLITIAVNFVLRAIAGAILINVFISPWLIIGVFFLALFLVSGKRYGEINYLKKESLNHRPVLADYSKELLRTLFSVFMASLILMFSLYSFSSEHQNLIWTTPLFVYIILRYYYLILSNNKIVRSPEKVFSDLPFSVSVILFSIISVILISL